MTEHHKQPRFLLAAVGANAGIALAKAVAFAFTGSAAMLAEAIHSVADTFNELLMMWGGRQARRPADDAFSFGYARERYFWSFIVAVLLFALGGLYSIREGISKIHGGHEVTNQEWAIGVILIAAVLEGASLRSVIGASRSAIGRGGVWRFIRATKSPEAPVVLLEDSAALVGLALAFTGLTATLVTGNPLFDAIASIAIGVLLTGVAIVLAIEMKGLLIGESVDRETAELIYSQLIADDGVVAVNEIRTQHLGPTTVLVAAKLVFDESLGTATVAATIDEIERRLKATVPVVAYVYLEPDLTETGLGRDDGRSGEEHTTAPFEPDELLGEP
jgi:cation diffusion facilitator family transporter